MTRDRRYISVIGQLIWYFKVYRPREKQGLMKYHFVCHNGKPVGYGLINIHNGREWISGGILPKYRKKGLGKLLFWCLRDFCNGSAYLEVLKTNKKAIKLYQSLDFKIIKKTNKIFIMKHE